jgi:hypothetical protein
MVLVTSICTTNCPSGKHFKSNLLLALPLFSKIKEKVIIAAMGFFSFPTKVSNHDPRIFQVGGPEAKALCDLFDGRDASMGLIVTVQGLPWPGNSKEGMSAEIFSGSYSKQAEQGIRRTQTVYIDYDIR